MDVILRPMGELRIEVKDDTKKAMRNSSAALKMRVQSRRGTVHPASIFLIHMLSSNTVTVLEGKKAPDI